MSTVDTQDFAAVLLQIGRGTAHARLSEALQRLVVAVVDTGKKGSLTLTLNVEPTKGADALSLSANVTTKVPAEQQSSIFYASQEGRLSRHDPRQLTLDYEGTTKENT